MSLSHISTIDGIANDVISKLDEKDQLHIAKNSLDDARSMHHSFGRWIRNTYSLWHDNELTKQWRTDSSTRKIVNGVDYSDDHPDKVSDLVIQTVWKKLRGIIP